MMRSARFSFTKTDISDLDIEYLLENSISIAQVLPQAQELVEYSPPPSPVDVASDDLPALSPTSVSSLPYVASSPVPDSPDTPLASRQRQYTLPRSPRSDIPLLSLATYSFPIPPSSPPPSDSRSSTPTPTSPITSPISTSSFSLLPLSSKFPHHNRTGTQSSTIMVELDDFFPRQPANTFTPFPTFSSSTTVTDLSSSPSLSSKELQQDRKGSLASSFFSTISSASSSSASSNSSDSGSTRTRTRTRSRTTSNRSVKTTNSSGEGGGGFDFGASRQPKLAAYPRYVPPKPVKPNNNGDAFGGMKKLRLFGGGR
ncbi:uncharacterized protein JCM6883_000959 [Sporobolomyces salmoneus]|uniref:uncharacterized protein n=1 Tax=Sporobolomyces salmoneus TaxID=183962 RepID=UPI0031738739